MTKSKAIKKLNQRTEPFSLSTNVTAGKPGEVTVKAVLSLMQAVKDLGGKTIQQVDRQVESYGVGSTLDDAEAAAIEKVIVRAGVI